MTLNKRPNKFFYILTLLVFLAQLALPTGARAEGETPPADPAVTEVATQAAPADAATPEAAPADATEAAPEPSATEAPAAEPVIDLTAVPDGTEVVVLDENGQPLPLGSQAAADVVAQGDPIWCADNVDPVALASGSFSSAGCTPTQSSLTDLDTYIKATLTYGWYDLPNGVIWIANSAITESANVFISGIGNENSLRVQGGWDGTSTYRAADYALYGTATTFTKAIKISWWGPLTINNLTVDGGGATPANPVPSLLDVIENGESDVSLSNITVKRSASEKTGLTVTSISSSKNVTLNSVNASNNGGHGAALVGSNTANYIITNSTFSNNGGQTVADQDNYNGLIVTTTGNISLDHVTANGNSLDGAQLNSHDGDGTSTGTVTVTNSTFGEKQNIWNGAADNSNQSSWGNGRDGLSIISAGATSLNAVTADYNGSDHQHGGNGIVVKNYLTGGISLSGVTANHNYKYGADLTSAHDLDVTGSTFNYNGDYYPSGGVLTDIGGHQNFTTTEANYNYYSGLYLGAGNSEGLSDFPDTTGEVSLTSVTTHDNGWGWADDRTDPPIDPLWAGISTKLTAPFACSNYSSYDNGQPDSITCIEVPSGGETPGGGETLPSGGDDWKHDPSFPEDHGLGIKNVEVSGGLSVDLSCGGGIGGYNLGLGGNQVSLPCGSLSGDGEGTSAALTFTPGAQLPAAVDSQFSFVAGLEVKLSASLKGDMLVSFALPAGAKASSFSILFWDGSKWIDLGGFESANGLFNVKTTQGGIYVLVSK